MKPLVSVDELLKLMPRLSLGKAGYYAPFLNAAMLEQGIVSKRRRCAFLAQLAHESAQLRYMEEIASGAAYEGRKDLGNIYPGDGKRYKGRGPIQLTGRDNYQIFGDLLGLDLENQPQLASKPENGFRIAALFWKRKGLNKLADQLTMKGDKAERAVFAEITKRINGGDNGLSDRLNYFRIAKQVLHNDDEDQPSPVAPPAVRPAGSEKEQEESADESQADTSAKTNVPSEATQPDAGPDLLGAAVNSATIKDGGKKLLPRASRVVLGWVGYVVTLYQANKLIGNILIFVVLIAVGVLIHWKWAAIKAKIKPHVLRLLK